MDHSPESILDNISAQKVVGRAHEFKGRERNARGIERGQRQSGNVVKMTFTCEIFKYVFFLLKRFLSTIYSDYGYFYKRGMEVAIPRQKLL